MMMKNKPKVTHIYNGQERSLDDRLQNGHSLIRIRSKFRRGLLFSQIYCEPLIFAAAEALVFNRRKWSETGKEMISSTQGKKIFFCWSSVSMDWQQRWVNLRKKEKSLCKKNRSPWRRNADLASNIGRLNLRLMKGYLRGKSGQVSIPRACDIETLKHVAWGSKDDRFISFSGRARKDNRAKNAKVVGKQIAHFSEFANGKDLAATIKVTESRKSCT